MEKRLTGHVERDESCSFVSVRISRLYEYRASLLSENFYRGASIKCAFTHYTLTRLKSLAVSQ